MPPMNELIIGTRGQITIPAEIRVKLGLQPGDRILFTEVEGGFSISKQTKKAVFKKPLVSNSSPTTPDPLK
jgi:AbrB family looped-hinge helix DNA binding protein